MITAVNNIELQNKYNNQQNFTGFKTPKTTKALDKFLKSQENLSTTRFIQGTLTNWLPKAILSRSVIDFSEFTFLEFIESGIFYFAAPLLGEHLFKNKLFSKIQPKSFRPEVNKNLVSGLKDIKSSNLDKALKNRTVATKAGILLACVTVPTLEYALGFAKNLFTLKVFKVSDFSKIANLNKNTEKDDSKEKRVESHSKSVLYKSAGVITASILAGLALAKYGHKSELAQKFSETLLEPGEKISKLLHKAGIKSEKTDNFLKEYLKLDFDNNNGKLALSKGQLAVTCTTGLFGYSSASKDRGKLDLYETWTRVPLVVLYTIFGSAIFDSAFKKLLAKKNKFPDLIQRDTNGNIAKVPTRIDLEAIAKQKALKNNSAFEKELETLIKQKAVITGVPYLFSLLVMGFTLSAISRAWTQYRYKHQGIGDENSQNKNATNNFAKENIQKELVAFEGFDFGKNVK